MNQPSKTIQKQGFTLVELMVVIVILGVLSMIGINAFTSSQVRSRDSKRKSDLENLQKALEFYYNDKGTYPLDSDTGNGVMVGCGLTGTANCNWGSEFSDENSTVYMIRLPKEANGAMRYFYVSETGANYKVYAYLENKEDQNLITPNVSTNCATSGNPVACNYGVGSVNAVPGTPL